MPDLKEKPPQEILETTFSISGYGFGDWLLEDVIFEFEVNENLEVLNFRISDRDAQYFKRLNEEMWLGNGIAEVEQRIKWCKVALERMTWGDMINEHREAFPKEGLETFFEEF